MRFLSAQESALALSLLAVGCGPSTPEPETSKNSDPVDSVEQQTAQAVEDVICQFQRGEKAPLLTNMSFGVMSRLESALQGNELILANSCDDQGQCFEFFRCSPYQEGQQTSSSLYRYTPVTLRTVSCEAKSGERLGVEAGFEGIAKASVEVNHEGHQAVWGAMRGVYTAPDKVQVSPDCKDYKAGSTQLVESAVVGAFVRGFTDKRGMAAKADAYGILRGEGELSQDVTVENRVGFLEACMKPSAAAPAPDCGAPIQFFLRNVDQYECSRPVSCDEGAWNSTACTCSRCTLKDFGRFPSSKECTHLPKGKVQTTCSGSAIVYEVNGQKVPLSGVQTNLTFEATTTPFSDSAHNSYVGTNVNGNVHFNVESTLKPLKTTLGSDSGGSVTVSLRETVATITTQQPVVVSDYEGFQCVVEATH